MSDMEYPCAQDIRATENQKNASTLLHKSLVWLNFPIHFYCRQQPPKRSRHGCVGFLDVRDLGEVAANIFCEPEAHINKGYVLSGPRAVTFGDGANIPTTELGRPIRYEAATVPQYVRHLGQRNMPLVQVMVQTVLHAGLRHGDAEHVDESTARLLGRPPRSLETYVHDLPTPLAELTQEDYRVARVERADSATV